MPIFKPIKPQKISEEVLSQLKKSILRGVFKAGDKLPSERQLTEQFHVSRGVVREAIKALEVTGFVNIRQGPTGGAFVNEVNFDRFNSGFLDLYLAYKLTMPELIQFRLFVEPEVTRLATLNLNDAYRRRLEEAINAEREVFESHDQRMKKLSEIHFVLAEMCGNQLFEGMVNTIIKLTHQIVAVAELENPNSLHAIGAHDIIVEAVLSGNPKAARQTMLTHLQQFTQSLLDMDDHFSKIYKF
jgi:GntR family transcriptional regulator, transcriptional repressor for pyruvate dehydrogenase complex